MKIAVIGTAGRKGLHRSLDWATMEKMISKIEICDEIISGGAAWADHAGLLFALSNEIPCRLYLPCEWDFVNKQYKDTGEVDWMKNPGGTANYYHRLYHSCTGKDSLREINEALKNPNISAIFGNGFHARNSLVAQECDKVIAFTFGKTEPNDGGTKNTWNLAKSIGKECVHYCIGDL